MLAELGGDVIEFQNPTLLAVLAWPDGADLTRRTEYVLSVFILTDDACEGDAMCRFGLAV